MEPGQELVGLSPNRIKLKKTYHDTIFYAILQNLYKASTNSVKIFQNPYETLQNLVESS